MSHLSLLLVAVSTLVASLPAVARDATWSGLKWATVEVDDSGRIASIELEPSLSPAFEAALRHEMASWAFEPARIDGAAVASRTHLGLHLRAQDRGARRAEVELVAVNNGPRPVDKQPLRYPPEALRRQIQGTVVLDFTVAPDGSVGQIAADDDAHPLLRRAAVSGARRWRFQPELVAGRPVATRIRAPISFCLAPGNQVCPVASSGAGAPARHPDALTAIDSPVRLKLDPAGRRIGG